MNQTEQQIQKIEVGQILMGTWGYDQTNASFFLVTKRTPKRVTLRELVTVNTQIGRQTMSGTSMPAFKPWDTDFRAEHEAGRDYKGGRNYSETGETSMTFYQVAPKGVFDNGGPLVRVPQPHPSTPDSEIVRIEKYLFLKPWDGKPVPTTWYA